ncbi:hypothetical protein [Haloterrigena salinisoli]|uniref:hypothetical protein n=1 Tax=Haloterrigena salinisoli TaxID=3132747 RepID=UPI0030CE55C5
MVRGEAYGQQLLNHVEAFLEDNFTPYVYQQEDGRVRNYSSNVKTVVDPTAKRECRLIDLVVDGKSVDPEARYSVATSSVPVIPNGISITAASPSRTFTSKTASFRSTLSSITSKTIRRSITGRQTSSGRPMRVGTYGTRPPTVHTRTSNPVSMTPTVRCTAKRD